MTKVFDAGKLADDLQALLATEALLRATADRPREPTRPRACRGSPGRRCRSPVLPGGRVKGRASKSRRLRARHPVAAPPIAGGGAAVGDPDGRNMDERAPATDTERGSRLAHGLRPGPVSCRMMPSDRLYLPPAKSEIESAARRAISSLWHWRRSRAPPRPACSRSSFASAWSACGSPCGIAPGCRYCWARGFLSLHRLRGHRSAAPSVICPASSMERSSSSDTNHRNAKGLPLTGIQSSKHAACPLARIDEACGDCYRFAQILTVTQGGQLGLRGFRGRTAHHPLSWLAGLAVCCYAPAAQAAGHGSLCATGASLLSRAGNYPAGAGTLAARTRLLSSIAPSWVGVAAAVRRPGGRRGIPPPGTPGEVAAVGAAAGGGEAPGFSPSLDPGGLQADHGWECRSHACMSCFAKSQ